jgi:transposase, IS30 family
MLRITLELRYQIAHDLRAGLTNARVAELAGIAPRRLDREIARCGGRRHYDAEKADAHRRTCGQVSAANHPTINCLEWQKIEPLLATRHSPEQARARAGGSMSLSTIYRYLKREQKASLLAQLRHPQKSGPAPRGSMVKRGVAQSIHDRPAEVLTRDRVGHAETDSLVGKRNEPNKIVVLLDRATRFVRLALVPDGSAQAVAKAFERWQRDARIPMLTVTSDQGNEFNHLSTLLPDNFYVCDPGKPYQKGAVENMNKLIRQYIPKGASLKRYTQAMLNKIADELNDRPRRRLSWKSPKQLLFEATTAPSI